ncbi:hypothetical protein [Pseudoteredinibacter isoporae]|uniref:hypothetical protein n=1 Tax=Pseudoteredinibacter isoporae TaxID=570281 RepID=UPI003342A3E1
MPERNPRDWMGENPRGSTKSPGAILDCDARSNPKGHLQEQMISPVQSATIPKGGKKLRKLNKQEHAQLAPHYLPFLLPAQNECLSIERPLDSRPNPPCSTSSPARPSGNL